MIEQLLQQPTSVLIDVTPKMASEWIENTGKYQRKISHRRVDEYFDMMKKGDWKATPTHQIGISKDGQIVDGQHRCHAVKKLNTPITMWVCFNCPDSIFDVIDRGMGRTKAQISSMAKCKYSSRNHISAINSLLLRIDAYDTSKQWDVADTNYLLNFYEEQFDFLYPKNYSGTKQLRSGHFRGAALRVLLHHPDRQQDIVDFIKIVAEGMPIDNCNIRLEMPLMLRSSLQNLHPSDPKDRWIAYFTSIKALSHALNGTVIVHKSNLMVRDTKESGSMPFPLYIDKKPTDIRASDWLQFNESI